MHFELVRESASRESLQNAGGHREHRSCFRKVSTKPNQVHYLTTTPASLMVCCWIFPLTMRNVSVPSPTSRCGLSRFHSSNTIDRDGLIGEKVSETTPRVAGPPISENICA